MMSLNPPNVRAHVMSRLSCAAGFAVMVTCVAPAAIGATDQAGKAQLKSITLSPATFSGPPGATQQVEVTGTYRGGTSHVIKTGDTFHSSNPAVATVSRTGLVTVLAGTGVGETAIISATNTATGISSGTGEDTAITVGTPSPNSIAAASATVTDNPLCQAIAPFYWEIGDQNAAIASDSIGTTYNATTSIEIDSASKLLYASYVVQVRGAASALTSDDINFLHFTSGYTNMPETSTASVCPPTLSPDTVNSCLALKDAAGYAFGSQNRATVGIFDYNSGHMEKHASLYMIPQKVPTTGVQQLGALIAPELGSGVVFKYTEPLMAGGVTTTASTYAMVLRNILNGSLYMHDALGTSAVCTLNSSTCNAYPGGTIFPLEAWHYSIGHWVEDNPATNGDGAFSSPGAEGFYPWIDKSKTYYGLIARSAPSAAYSTAECGRLIRRAFITGVVQSGTIPTP